MEEWENSATLTLLLLWDRRALRPGERVCCLRGFPDLTARPSSSAGGCLFFYSSLPSFPHSPLPPFLRFVHFISCDRRGKGAFPRIPRRLAARIASGRPIFYLTRLSGPVIGLGTAEPVPLRFAAPICRPPTAAGRGSSRHALLRSLCLSGGNVRDRLPQRAVDGSAWADPAPTEPGGGA